jgi:hypothetical protein
VSLKSLGEWTSVFPDAAMTLAAVDRLVYHAVILEINSKAIAVAPRQRDSSSVRITRHDARQQCRYEGDRHNLMKSGDTKLLSLNVKHGNQRSRSDRTFFCRSPAIQPVALHQSMIYGYFRPRRPGTCGGVPDLAAADVRAFLRRIAPRPTTPSPRSEARQLVNAHTSVCIKQP